MNTNQQRIADIQANLNALATELATLAGGVTSSERVEVEDDGMGRVFELSYAYQNSIASHLVKGEQNVESETRHYRVLKLNDALTELVVTAADKETGETLSTYYLESGYRQVTETERDEDGNPIVRISYRRTEEGEESRFYVLTHIETRTSLSLAQLKSSELGDMEKTMFGYVIYGKLSRAEQLEEMAKADARKQEAKEAQGTVVYDELPAWNSTKTKTIELDLELATTDA